MSALRIRWILSSFFFLIYCTTALWITSPRMPPTGDEPHYLIAAHSLAIEGDLSLRENYLQRDYRLFYPGLIAKRTTFSADRTVELPAFAPGLSILLSPFYRIAFYAFPTLLLPFLRILMCAIASVALYHLIACAQRFHTNSASMLVFVAAGFASPMLTYSSMFYPEMPGFLLIVLALRNFQDMDAPAWKTIISLSLIGSTILWIHPKYLALSLLIFLTTAALLWKLRGSVSGYAKKATIHIFISAAGIFSFFLFLYLVYGSWSPNRIYGGAQRETTLIELLSREGPERIWIMLRMLPGYFLDQRFGVIVYAPAYAAFFPAFFWSVKKFGSRVLPLVVLFSAHFLLLSWGAQMGGYAPPSRHFVVMIPFLVLPIYLVFTKWSKRQRLVFGALASAGWAISIQILLNYRSIYTNATWRNPNGYSEFWQLFGMQHWIPRFTSSPPDLWIASAWACAVAIIAFILYPREISA